MVVAIHSGSVNQPAAPAADLNQVRQLTQPATPASGDHGFTRRAGHLIFSVRPESTSTLPRSRRMAEFEVKEGDVVAEPADLLLLKFAQHFYGADEAVASRLISAALCTEEQLRPPP